MKPDETHIENMLGSLKTIELSEQERTAMRSRLLSYADMHEVLPATPRTPVLSPFSYTLFYSRAFVGSMLVLVLLIGTTGVSFAAQGSLPGQPLYAIKVDVTEPLQGALIASTADKAVWENVLAERRLTEATDLATRNELATSTQVYLSEQVALHADRSQKGSDTLAASGDGTAALSVRSDLEARLSAHIAFLSLLSPRLAAAGDATTGMQVAALIQKVDTVQVAVAKSRDDSVTALASADLTDTVTATSSATLATASEDHGQHAKEVAFVKDQDDSLHTEEARILRKAVPMLFALPVATTSTSTVASTTASTTPKTILIASSTESIGLPTPPEDTTHKQ